MNKNLKLFEILLKILRYVLFVALKKSVISKTLM